ncbi:Protein DSF2 [Candida viswanathii]|uniref:Protein DSF2 n=1 Tax=Candida viswanathii TaxID=5486 RepID=A0A367Y7T1_9ASCO|nr:Protein DSF2 [Candida viswanathii]
MGEYIRTSLEAPSNIQEYPSSPLQSIERLHRRSPSATATSAPNSTTSPTSPISQQLINDANMDRESIYSFDSVSTSGRLLDRLGLEDDDENFEDDSYSMINKRESMVSIQTTGRLLDRLELDGSRTQPHVQNKMLPQQRSVLPIQPVNNLADIRGLKNQQNPQALQRRLTELLKQRPSEQQPEGKPNLVASVQKPIQRTMNNVQPPQKPRQAPAHLKHVPMNLVFKNMNNSAETIKSDAASLKKVDTQKSQTPEVSRPPSIANVPSPLLSPNNSNPSSGASSPALSASSSTASLRTLQNQYLSDPNVPTLSSLEVKTRTNRSNSVRPQTQRPTNVTRTPSAPAIRRRSSESTETVGMRVRSDSTNSNSSFNTINSNTSQGTLTSASTAKQQIDLSNPDHRTNYALQLRSVGNHREASYQLQIAANEPNNYPKAMFLYAMALKFGQGVKQNDRHAIKWLTKCILLSSLSINAHNISIVIEKLNGLPLDDVVKLIMKNLRNTVDKDVHQNGQDPLILYPIFLKLTKTQIAKVVSISRSKGDIVACSYHELGMLLINGCGQEEDGICCLQKAGSMGYIDAMVKLGEIWSQKTKTHKKDLNKAAAWLRLAELLGVKDIGNSWIYKAKYNK